MPIIFTSTNDNATSTVTDTELVAIEGVTASADTLPYFDSPTTAATTPLTAAGRAILGGADAAAQRTTLGLGTLATQSGTLSGTNTGDQTITLTGDISGSGTGSFVTTLPTVNVTTGSFGSSSTTTLVTANGKGLVTSLSTTPISIVSTAVTDFIEASQDAVGTMLSSEFTYSDATPLLSINSIANTKISGLGTLASQSGTFSGTSSGTNTGDQTITLTGDVTGTGSGPFSTTLATVNSTVGSFGSSSTIPNITVNGKGLITGVTTSSVSISSTSVTDFTEAVQDTVGSFIQNGTGITWAYNDAGNTLTPTVTITQYTDEMAQDAFGAMASAEFTYSDVTNALSINSISNAKISGLGTLATQSGTFSGTHSGASSGTNTGDQTISLTGDISGSGTGSITATLPTVNVNTGLMGSSSTSTLVTANGKGLITAVSTTPIAITNTQVSGLGTLSTQSGTFSGTHSGTSSGTNTGDQTITLSGDISGSGTGSISATLPTVNVNTGLIGSSSTSTLVTANGKGLITALSTTPIAITNTQVSGLGTLSTQSGTFSGASSGTNTGDQTITLTGDVTGTGTGSFAATIPNNTITLAKFQDIATQSFLGRITASTGDPEVLTATQATAILNVFTSLLSGLVPASGGGTTNFLRADGTWQPAGGGSVNIAQTEVDFGTIPVSEGTFIITDAAVSTGSQILANLAYEAPTDKDLDECEMDSLSIICSPGSGSFSMYVTTVDGSYVADKFKINYLVG